MGDATIIIPARLGSTRFPGKVLANRTGWPLIRHVYEAVRGARSAKRIVVATDDQRVMDAVKAFGGEAVMTSADHPNGTSRLAEAARVLGLGPDEIVVNAQGDEPEMEPAIIDEAVGALVRSGAPVATAATPMGAGERIDDPNIVKVVVRADGCAMYFSRARIPFVRDATSGPHARPLRHVGLYVYRRSFLDHYLGLETTLIERTEMLEQLRILHHGHAIAVAIYHGATRPGIDTPEQYDGFVKRWNERKRPHG